MTSFQKRITTAVIALPLLFTIIFFLPQMNHLAFAIVIFLAALFATQEMNDMCGRKGKVSRVTYLAPLLPITQYILLYNAKDTSLTFYLFILLSAIVLLIQIFKGAKDNFDSSIDVAARSSLVLIYPGLLSTFLIDLLYLPDASAYILLFLALIFGSDSFAYFTGKAFGKNNKGIFKVSPNKSIAGFIGGTVLPGIVGMCAYFIWPEIFTFGAFGGFILGFIVAAFGSLGDLLESTIKRSADMQDSGVIIPGRGGILDSIDSILIGCPFFIIILHIMGVA